MVTQQRDRIRFLFLQHAEAYRLAEGARLLGISPATLRREAEDDRREEYRSGEQWRFTWRQLACIALRRWSLADVQDALGSDAAAVLPPLLALRSVTVRLPEFIVLALETIAAEDQTTLDHALHGELMDFAGTFAGRAGKAIPGFRRAYLFPGQE